MILLDFKGGNKLNERERAEFERHKNEAEKQLNQMYYGSNKKTTQNSGLTMPPFLASPTRQGGVKSQAANSVKSTTVKTEKSSKKPTSPQKNTSLKGGNILNFLNFKGMKMDNDRLIILAICLLLAGEEIDELLMLALIYIML